MRSWESPVVPDLAVAGVDPLDLPVQVHDTAAGALVPLDLAKDEVTLYVCGITPYDATHLGHAATYLLFDTLQRVCRDAGTPVRYVQNVTDVDDPLLERANQTGEDWVALAEREVELFRQDMTALRILAPAAYIGAVEAIPDIVEAVAELRDKGAAYDLDGDLYFSTASATAFGDISHLAADAMSRIFGERGGDPTRPGKKDPLDPLLWQGAREGEPSWDSPLGSGRPGWHIECAAIAMQHLGPTIDIQGGGVDLVFPHHEMSAAQATTLSGEPRFARNYVHQAMVGYQGEKMSKSKGNLVLVSKLREAGIDPMAIRIALLNHSHTTDWEWKDDEIVGASNRLANWRKAFARETAPPAAALIEGLRTALRNGLDTAEALQQVDSWTLSEGNDAEAATKAAAAVDALLGIS